MWPDSRRYLLTERGRRVAVLFTKTYTGFLAPGRAAFDPGFPTDLAKRSALPTAWRTLNRKLEHHIDQGARDRPTMKLDLIKDFVLTELTSCRGGKPVQPGQSDRDRSHPKKADRTLVEPEHRHLDRLLGGQAMHDAFQRAGGAGRPSLVLTRSPHDQ
jgi:hypothetical protein